jgi:hypothetical protein
VQRKLQDLRWLVVRIDASEINALSTSRNELPSQGISLPRTQGERAQIERPRSLLVRSRRNAAFGPRLRGGRLYCALRRKKHHLIPSKLMRRLRVAGLLEG